MPNPKQPLKYYPVPVLIILVIIILLFKVFIESLLKKEFTVDFQLVFSFLGSGSLITLLITLINKYGISLSMVRRKMHLPDLNGRYEGNLISSFKDELNYPVKKKCALEIVQDLTGFKVFGYFGELYESGFTSKSESSINNIDEVENGCFTLMYLYHNTAEPGQEKLFYNNHSGTAVLQYNPIDKSLTGYYYNYDRKSSGSFQLQFKSKLLTHKL